MKLQLLLEQLADGQFHSGSEIGGLLGVSRTAVWKSLSQLSRLGLECESVKGKGYRLPYPVDLLAESRILSSLSDELRENVDLEVLLTTESTNAALAQKDQQAKEYSVCLAEHQSSGRGRRGRSWVSPFGRNIYMSLGFELSGGVEALSGLSLVVGLAVVRALEANGVKGAGLKWPNDVWVEGKKVCGILVELQGEATTAWNVVVGIGINVSMAEGDDGVDAIDQEWTAIDRYCDVDRNKLVADLLMSLCAVLEEFRCKGFEVFLPEWESLDVLKGRPITINQGAINGVSEGVDVSAALLMRLDSGELQVVNAGEVSVRCL